MIAYDCDIMTKKITFLFCLFYMDFFFFFFFLEYLGFGFGWASGFFLFFLSVFI